MSTFRAYCDRRAQDNAVLKTILNRMPGVYLCDQMLARLTDPFERKTIQDAWVAFEKDFPDHDSVGTGQDPAFDLKMGTLNESGHAVFEDGSGRKWRDVRSEAARAAEDMGDDE